MSDISTESYKTVSEEKESRLVIERSEFIARVKRVASEDEAKAWIKLMKSEYKDATHNCSAYVTGADREHQFYDDNGEPHGTAGRPILGAIDSMELTNVAVVVTRYFGGKKLGVRGLIEAYGQAAREALENSEPVTVLITRTVRILADYKHVDRIHYLIQENGARIDNEIFLADVEMFVSIARNNAEDFTAQVKPFAKEAAVV